MTAASLLARYQPQIEAKLTALIDTPSCSPSLLEAMKYSLLDGGKRIRPILTLATAESLGGDMAHAMVVGCTIEMIHCYSLIHDDLPAMDNDDLRRGRATNHKVFGDAQAILAGDGLLTLAFTLLAKSQVPQALRIIEHIGDCAGLNGMVGGQALDMAFENNTCNLAQLQTIHQHKTGALLTTSVICGGYVAGASDQTLGHLLDFAQHTGLAFQIADDILDVTQTSETLGKDAGSDVGKNKSTYPSLMGLDKAIQTKDEHCQKARAALDHIDADTTQLEILADFIVQRTS